MKMLTTALKTFSVIAATTLTAASLNADVVLYDGANDPGLFVSAPGGFTFGDFSGAVVDNGGSFSIDGVTDTDGVNGLFGGVGRDLLDGILDFDPATNQVAVEYRFLPGNAASSFNLVLAELDGADEDQFQFGLGNATLSDAGGGFTRALFDVDTGSSQFTQGSGDGLANYGLRQWQIQSGFGSTDALALEVRQVAVIGTAGVPEPSSLALLGLGATALLGRRRK